MDHMYSKDHLKKISHMKRVKKYFINSNEHSLKTENNLSPNKSTNLRTSLSDSNHYSLTEQSNIKKFNELMKLKSTKVSVKN